MSTPGNQTNTHQTEKKFWRDYNPTEKMAVINIGFVALYSLLTFALCWIAANQYRGMRTDERPWVRIYDDIPTIDSQSFAVPTHAINSGKTPAKSFEAKYFIEVVRNGQDPKLDETKPIGTNTTGVLFPNLPIDMPVPYSFTQSEYQDFRDKRAFFVLYVKVTYTDFFRTEHSTKHCQFFGMPPGGYTAKKCTDYNDIDDN
jgi:hypothetical protein